MNTNLQVNDQIGAPAARVKLALASPPPAPEKLLLNRELSLVEFFRQVLAEGLEAENPLLERLRFLTIFSNIIDEFFMVRVSGLKEEVEHGWPHPSPDGMTADEQLREIRHRLRPMIVEQMRCLKEEILPQLAEQGIVVAPYQSLSHEQRAELDEYFQDRVLPGLTPLAVEPAHPFPYSSRFTLKRREKPE